MKLTTEIKTDDTLAEIAKRVYTTLIEDNLNEDTCIGMEVVINGTTTVLQIATTRGIFRINYIDPRFIELETAVPGSIFELDKYLSRLLNNNTDNLLKASVCLGGTGFTRFLVQTELACNLYNELKPTSGESLAMLLESAEKIADTTVILTKYFTAEVGKNPINDKFFKIYGVNGAGEYTETVMSSFKKYGGKIEINFRGNFRKK
jgi:hypothetical protein